MRGELDAFPGGWQTLPKDRIHHCHVKNAVKDAAGKIVWSPVDIGYIDWGNTVQGAPTGRLHRRCEPGNTLEKQWHTRRSQPNKLGGHEEGTAQGECMSGVITSGRTTNVRQGRRQCHEACTIQSRDVRPGSDVCRRPPLPLLKVTR